MIQTNLKRAKIPFIMVGLIALLMVLSGAVIAPAKAAADNCAGSVGNVQWQHGTHVQGDRFESGAQGQAGIEFDWSVNADAAEGDSFTLTLPNELKVKGSQNIELLDGGNVVGTGVWNGKTLTVTLSDYATSHGHITGSAFFTVEWDRNVVDKDGADYNLQLTGCDGGGNLPGTYLPEGPSGINQASGKSGMLSEDSKSAYWNIFVATTTTDVSEPLVVTDFGGNGFELTCEDVRVVDRTPYPHTQIRDTPIDDSRWSCEATANGGATITFHPMEDGRYQAAGESLMIEFTGATTPALDDLHEIVNKANISVAENGEPKDVEGVIELPQSGGSGSGHRAEFNISKEVAGDAPQSEEYTFSYKCLGDEFTDLHPIGAGETSETITTKSSSRCIILEKDIPDSATVSFDVSGDDVAVEEIPDGIAVTFAPGVNSSVQVTATNTFSEDPSGEPTPEPSEDPSGEPTPEPSEDPSGEPTPEPSEDPSGEPTPEPSEDPSGEPTPEPSEDPSDAVLSGESTDGPGLAATGASSRVIWAAIFAFALVLTGTALTLRRRRS